MCFPAEPSERKTKQNKTKQNKTVYLQGVLRSPGHLGDTFETEAAMLVI
jgi:hypothetical protein